MPGAVRLQHFAGVSQGEDGFDAAGDIVGDQRNRAGWRYGGQKRVADTMLRDQRPNVRVEAAHGLAGEIAISLEQREGALLTSQVGRCGVGGTLDLTRPV